MRLQCDYAAQDVLDSLRSAGSIGGFRLAAVVGGGGNNPDFISVVVDRLPQRLVLNADRFSVWRGRPLTHEASSHRAQGRARAEMCSNEDTI